MASPFFHRLSVLLAATALVASGCESETSENQNGTVDGVVADTGTTETDGVVDSVVADTTPPPTCDVPTDCDDGKACTTERCDIGADGAKHCAWERTAGWCFINNVCAADGAPRDDDPCEVCDAAAPEAWHVLDDGTACDDQDMCTADSVCSAGRCGGEAIVCEPASTCVTATCDPTLGCVFTTFADATACDDGLFCTADDACADGMCIGIGNPCEDDDPCTDATCSETDRCVVTFNAAPCDDGNPCSSGDTCRVGVCATGPAPTDCDDQNACTIDVCDPIAGCAHIPTQTPCCQGLVSVCDDGNACTDDACDPDSGACTYAPNTGPCDDGDACTTNDVCAAEMCGGAIRDCDDDDPCSSDSCSRSEGCLYGPLSGPSCDDELSCSTGDVCTDGLCAGDMSQCLCQPDLSSFHAVKITLLQMGTEGIPGQGLDIDLDPTTCSPESNCSNGIDNALSLFAAFANGPIIDAVDDGDLMLILSLDRTTSGAVTTSIFDASLAPGNGGCDFQSSGCDYRVDRSMLTADTCLPTVQLPSTLNGGILTGGGPGTSLPFALPLSDTAELSIVIGNLRIDADVTMAGGEIVGLSGLLGGAVAKQALLAALDEVPEDDLPVPKATLTTLLNTLVQNDIDTDGDGSLDAASIGIRFEATAATVVGTK
ncbi:MAG: hypothetical protein ACI9MR_000504 [Myxococcota bacterium]|jgi:hypothetical protein